MVRKRLIHILGALLLLSLTCITALIIYSFAYTRWGRITNFAPLTEYTIPDTNYQLIATTTEKPYAKYVLLSDPQNNTIDKIRLGFDPHITSFQHGDRTYTLLRFDGGGSDGAYNYVMLGVDPLWIEYAHACSTPKLVGNTLEFYDPAPNAQRCDWFPFDWREFPIIKVELD